MALTGLDIYKKLPKTNCGDCGLPTCLAFGMKLAAGQAELAACPHVSEEAAAELTEASAPPIRLVTIGQGDTALKVGGEIVMYRHEKTFYNPPGIGLLIEDTMSEAEVDERMQQTKAASFERIGQQLKADVVALRCASGDGAKFAALVEKVNSSLGLPMVLMSYDPEVMKSGLEACKGANPLIHGASGENCDAMAALGKEYSCPVAVSCSEGLAVASDISHKLMEAGVKDIVIEPAWESPNDTLKELIQGRRAALRQKVREVGFPFITFPCKQTDDTYLETALAGAYVIRYAGLVILSSLEAAKALPLVVLRQNIYTDPQQPMQVEEGIYPINNPTADSPVLITTNFSLTYFTVSGEMEASRVPSWLLVMDAEGLSVLTGWAAGKFTPDRIAKFVNRSGIDEKVSKKRLIIPGYVAQISGELEEELEGWEISVGVREAADIPKYLKQVTA
ncbi:MAG: acetyl-CoA decarbonylase/synthase complex subunit gamma [Actinobacteria bacterium]|nr:MAG: acetyl-CoA decarbonylase/synthase complex subunit gamma [Actinomycetota bacterium]